MDSDTAVSTNCLPAGVQIGEYRVLDVIGEGGFGIVYRARDIALDREVAIKEYMPAALAGRQSSHHVHVRSQHRGAFDAGLRSFINEARLLARFSHPTLVHVYRFFEAGGTAYMVMRYYEGQTLRRVLDNPSVQMDQAQLGALLAPVLDVLEILHAEDCFHRDIAPDNIFVQRDGSPVLLDFGAARRIIGDMTQALTMVLKPGFAPIEQYVDDGAMPQGAWTDIYQVGALIYLAVTGKTPPTSVARMVNDPLQPLSAAQAPGYSDAFLYGMHRTLAVRPQERPQSITELKRLLGLSTPAFAAPAAAGLAVPAFISDPVVAFPVMPAHPVTAVQPAPLVQAPTAARPVHTEMPLPTPAPAPVAPVAPATSLLDGVQALDIAQMLPPAPAEGSPVFAAPVPAPAAMEAPVPPVAPQVMPPATAPVVAPAAPVAAPRPEAARAAARPAAPVPPATVARKRSLKPLAIASCAVVAVAVAGLLWFNHSQEQARAATLAARDSLAWQQTLSQPTLPRLQDYLDSFPEGRHRAEAQTLMQRMLNEASLASTPREELVLPQPDPATDLAAVEPAAPPPAVTEPAVPVATATVAAVDAGAQGIPGAPATPDATAKPEVRKPVAMGKVLFRIAPWGYVSVNRAPARTSPPMTQLELPEGQYRIDISNPGAGSVTAVTRTIQVQSGVPVTVSHLFE